MFMRKEHVSNLFRNTNEELIEPSLALSSNKLSHLMKMRIISEIDQYPSFLKQVNPEEILTFATQTLELLV